MRFLKSILNILSVYEDNFQDKYFKNKYFKAIEFCGNGYLLLIVMRSCFTAYVFVIFHLVLVSPALSEVYSYAKNNTVIGNAQSHSVNGNESLIEIARKFGLGYNEIVSANPDLDPFLPGDNANVLIPSQWVLPNNVPDDGIVINLTELRLYYFFSNNGIKQVRTFPVGIGYEGFDTPTGTFRIIEKKIKPTWHVPESVKKEKPYLPSVVPPGPNNPLGSHALRLSNPSYLIHGTNRPWSIGRRASAGCIRLYPEDIPKLFGLVQSSTRVTIIRQPVKVGIIGNRIYIEIHEDNEESGLNYLNEAVRVLTREKLLDKINTEELYEAVKDKRGIPIPLSS